MWKQLELPYTVSGMVKSCDYLGNLVQCLTNKCLPCVPAFPVSVYTQTEINACVHTDIRTIIVKVVPNWKQTIMFISVRTNKQTAVYPYNGILYRNKREPTSDTYNNMGKFQIYCADTKKPDTKENLLYDSIYIKFRTNKILYDRSQNSGLGWGGVGKFSTENHILRW